MTQARGSSTRRRAYSEEYTSTVQPVNKRHLHSTTTIQLHLTTADYQRIRQDLASEFFLNKTTRIYARELGLHFNCFWRLETKDKGPRIQETQDYNDDDASRLFNRLLFQKKRTRRKHEAAGYIASEFFEDKNLDPPTFASKSKRLGGYTQ